MSRKYKTPVCLAAVMALSLGLAGCPTAPKGESARRELTSNVESTLARLRRNYPGMTDSIDRAHGYAVFPGVGKGGVGVGGAYGRGEVYEQGRLIGHADLSQATIGFQLGGQKFDEVILFENEAALEEFKRGEFAFSANASAVALKSGEAVAADYENGVAVFVEPRAGAMFEASIGGQSFTFEPVVGAGDGD
jgi:lipid-binding SYLF domain-containing protein